MFVLLSSVFPLSDSQPMPWFIYIDAASWFCFLSMPSKCKEHGDEGEWAKNSTLSWYYTPPPPRSVTLPLCVSPPLWTSDEREVPYLPTPLPPFTPISASIQGGLLCTAVSLLTPVEYTAGDELPVQTRALRMRLQICNTITAQQMKRALMERMTNITISVARGRPALCGFASLMCARRGRWFGESGKRKWQGLKFYYQCLLSKRWHRAYAFFSPCRFTFLRSPSL